MPLQVPTFYNALNRIKKVTVKKSCPVSGEKIMDFFGISPGKAVGEIKEIMLDWLDENPELTEDELLDRVDQEYGDKLFWVWKNGKDMESGFIAATYNEPFLESNGTVRTIPTYELPYYVEESEYRLESWKEQKRAVELPLLYSAMCKSKQARAIFDEAASVLAKLEKIDGFKLAHMCIDEYNDLSGTIEWTDLKPDYIL